MSVLEGIVQIGGQHLQLVPGSGSYAAGEISYIESVVRFGHGAESRTGQENTVSWADLSAGIGPNKHVPGSRYYLRSSNVDARWPNIVHLSGLVQTATITSLDTAPSLIKQFLPGGAVYLAAGASVWKCTGVSLTPAAPGTTCSVALAGVAGIVTAGAHAYKVTFVSSVGESAPSSASDSVTTTAANGKVSLTAIPTGASDITSRKIYRTKAGGTTYYLLTTINDNSTTTYTDNTADASLSTLPPGGQTVGDVPFGSSILTASATVTDLGFYGHTVFALCGSSADYYYSTYESVPSTACTAALAGAGAGNVNSGTHSYKVTYVTASGETGTNTASNIVTTTAGDGQVNLTAIPVSSTGFVTARKIYRTEAGGSTYKLLATISNNTATTYADNIADGSLGATAPATNVWAQPTTTSALTKPKYMITSGDVRDDGVIVFGYTPNLLRTSTQAAQASPAISPPTSVGDGSTNITGLDRFQGQVVVFKEDSVSIVDLASGDEEEIIPRSSGSYDSTRAGSTSWLAADGALYFRRGANFFKFTGQGSGAVVAREAITSVGPDHAKESTTQILGVPQQVFGHERWLYALTQANDSSYGIACYDEHPEMGPRWHQYLDLGSSTTTTALGWFQPTAITSNPVLLLGRGTPAVSFVVQPSAAAANYPLADTAYRYAASGTITLQDVTHPDVILRKYPLRLFVDSLDVDATNGLRIVPSYSLDGATFTSFSGSIRDGGDPIPYTNTSSANSTHRRLRLRFALSSGSTSHTPKILSIAHEYQSEQPVQQVHSVTVHLDSENNSITGNELLDQLLTWREQAGPVQYIDVRERTWNARVAGFSETLVASPKSQTPLEAIKIDLRLVRPIVRPRYRYNTGFVYGSAASPTAAEWG